VDRLDSHGPNLEKAGFKFVYEKGYAAKQHGLRESSKAVLSLDTR
jgi:hypothetical protein